MAVTPHQQVTAAKAVLVRIEAKTAEIVRSLQRLEKGELYVYWPDLADAEVAVLESAVRALSENGIGMPPPDDMWQDSDTFMAKVRAKDRATRSAHQPPWDNTDYFYWFTIWLKNTSTFIDYLEGAMLHTETASGRRANPWGSGSFYLVAFVVLAVVMLAIARLVPPFLVPIIIVGAVASLGVVGAFQLRHDDRLKEEHFLTLVGMSYRELLLFWRKPATPTGTRDRDQPQRPADME